jgi:hypothetical protein
MAHMLAMAYTLEILYKVEISSIFEKVRPWNTGSDRRYAAAELRLANETYSRYYVCAVENQDHKFWAMHHCNLLELQAN